MKAAPAAAPAELTATDVKQWAYCPRIPYFRHVMPVDFVRTWPMKHGHNIEAALKILEKRRTLHRYHLQRGERRFGVWLHSPRLALTGKLDLLIVDRVAAYPVDFKNTQGGVRYNHQIQLTAYALLVEDQLQLRVRSAFIYLVPVRELIRVAVTAALRDRVHEALATIRCNVAGEQMPDPTPIRARCVGCEYRNYCGDIW